MNHFSVPSGSTELAATHVGGDATVVFLHAGVCDRRSWYPTMARLEPRAGTIAYDRRGFGQTPAPAERYDQRDDLAAVVTTCVDGPVTLVGNSQGGRIAIDFACAHPDRVARLVLIASAVSGAPEPDWDREIGAELVAAIEAAEQAGDLDEVNRLEALVWLDGPAGPEGRVAGEVRDLFLDMNGVALAGDGVGAEEPASAFDGLEALTMPVLVIVGLLDLPHVLARSRAIAEAVPTGYLITLPGVAHVPQLEEPDVVARLVREFLDET